MLQKVLPPNGLVCGMQDQPAVCSCSSSPETAFCLHLQAVQTDWSVCGTSRERVSHVKALKITASYMTKELLPIYVNVVFIQKA